MIHDKISTTVENLIKLGQVDLEIIGLQIIFKN